MSRFGSLRAQPTMAGISLATSAIRGSPDGRMLAAADGTAVVYRVADGRTASLTTIQRGAGREAFIASGGAFSGDPSLAFCSVEPAKRQRASVLSDFVAGK
jgi:hypothetical protein